MKTLWKVRHTTKSFAEMPNSGSLNVTFRASLGEILKSTGLVVARCLKVSKHFFTVIK